MLTPRFEITQTDSEVAIIVHAPYANIKDTEVYVDGHDFRFYSTPYYLRLKLPGEIEENDVSTGSYDCEKGDFSLKFSKVKKGEHFENLDMITTLLAPLKKRNIVGPNIEVIGNPSANDENTNISLNETNTENSGDEWFVHQQLPTQNVTILSDSSKYGFGNKISGALAAFEPAWIKEIIDLPLPDTTPQSERKYLREQKELSDFSEEHYMADLMQADSVEPYIAYVPEWNTLQIDNISLSDTEVDLLKELPNKEYLLTTEENRKLLLNLVDILYGSCYNHRTTLGENNVESGWTINKLSSTLCWFQEFNNINEVIIACIRRSLCYPLFRNWNLSIEVFNDVKKVIKLGKKYIIKKFCEIHSLFNNSYEPRYLLNQLYVKDYLIWLQQIPESLIESLNLILNDVQVDKMDMNLDLVELEEAAYSVEQDLVIENAVHEMADHIDDLSIDDKEKEKPKNISAIKDKLLKYLLSSNSSSTDTSDTDSETDSETSSSSSTTSNSSLDSDDIDEQE